MENVKTSYGRIVKRKKSNVSLPKWLKVNEEEEED